MPIVESHDCIVGSVAGHSSWQLNRNSWQLDCTAKDRLTIIQIIVQQMYLPVRSGTCSARDLKHVSSDVYMNDWSTSHQVYTPPTRLINVSRKN